MKNLALKTAGTIFLAVSFMHLLRYIFKIQVTVAGFCVPLWFSLAGFIVPLLLAVWMFKAGDK
jgi:hypothetical protein